MNKVKQEDLIFEYQKKEVDVIVKYNYPEDLKVSDDNLMEIAMFGSMNLLPETSRKFIIYLSEEKLKEAKEFFDNRPVLFDNFKERKIDNMKFIGYNGIGWEFKIKENYNE